MNWEDLADNFQFYYDDVFDEHIKAITDIDRETVKSNR